MKIIISILLLFGLKANAQIKLTPGTSDLVWYSYYPSGIVNDDSVVSILRRLQFANDTLKDSIINYEYLLDTAGNIIDSSANYYLQPDTSINALYTVRYRVADGKGKIVPYATLTPNGAVSYLSQNQGHWYEVHGNKFRVLRYTGQKDIKGNDIYERDILYDKNGKKHTVYYRNGCFRYGLEKPTDLDSILYNKNIIKDSLFIHH